MNIGDFVILILLAGWIAAGIGYLYRVKKRGGSIHCIGCGGCKDGKCKRKQ